jgi:hypothetical protein
MIVTSQCRRLAGLVPTIAPRLALVVALAMAVAPSTAHAAPVRYAFAGTTNLEHQTAVSSPWQIPAEERPFEGSFLYDPANLVTPISEFTVAIAGHSIDVSNDSPSARNTTLAIAATAEYVYQDTFPGGAVAGVTFYDDDSSLLSAGELPATLHLADFDRVDFSVSGGHSLCPVYPVDFCIQSQEVSLWHRGDVTTLAAVPEPATIWLAIAGLVGVALMPGRSGRTFLRNRGGRRATSGLLRRHRAWLAIAVLLVGPLAVPAAATGIRYRFAGESDLTHESDAAAPWPIPQSSQPFAGSFVYDPTNLVAPLAEFTVTFAGQTLDLPTPLVATADDSLQLAAWRGYMFANNFPGEVSGELMFVDRDSSKLSANELPPDLTLADFDEVDFNFDAAHEACPMHPTEPCATAQQVVLLHRGKVVTLSAIPEPGSLLLVAAGAAALAVGWRRRSRRPC